MHSNRHLHWVCFTCRKQIRKPFPPSNVPSHKRKDTVVTSDCPVCRAPMVDMGSYFRPPRRNDRRAWEQVQLLAEHGVRFYTGGAAYIWASIPITQRSLRAAQSMLARYSDQAQTEGRRLLQQIARKPPK